MKEVTNTNRREKRKASGRGSSLLSDLEDDFLDIEKNFKPEAFSASTVETKEDSKETRNDETTKAAPSVGKSGNKPTTKWQQTDNIADVKLTTNRQQTDNKVATSKELIRETGNKVATKPTTLSATKWQQTDNKLATNVSFSQLIGLQKNIVIFVYNACKQSRGKTTDAITLDHFASNLNTSTGTVKTTLQRLEKKNCITRIAFKNGRGGWSKYELAENIFRELLLLETDNKLATNWQQTDNKVGAKLATEPTTSSPSSSSINITTTNYKADALANVQIELTESLMAIGFNNGHIDQLKRDSTLSSEDIQNSLNAFAFDLGFEDVRRKVRSPIGLIMKLLKNGQAYVSEKGYESDEDRLYRESIERAEKKKEEKKNLESKLVNIKFEEWLEGISNEDKKNLVEPIGEFMGLIHHQELKEYFKREVYSANSFN